jgi:hypothetical protein
MDRSNNLHAKYLVGEITEKQYEEREYCKMCFGTGEFCENGEWFICDCEGGEKINDFRSGI